MKKIVLAIFAVMVLSLSLLVGCGENTEYVDDFGSEVGVENLKTLEGTTWNVIRFEADREQITPKEDSASVTVTFKDGDAVLKGLGEEDRVIAYSYEDGVLIIEGTTCDVRGETIIVTEGEITMTMVLQKE